MSREYANIYSPFFKLVSGVKWQINMGLFFGHRRSVTHFILDTTKGFNRRKP
jgi:hypothetical protein